MKGPEGPKKILLIFNKQGTLYYEEKKDKKIQEKPERWLKRHGQNSGRLMFGTLEGHRKLIAGSRAGFLRRSVKWASVVFELVCCKLV